MKPWLMTKSLQHITRRYFLEDCWSSIGAIALTSFFNDKLFAEAVNPMAPRKPHFPAKAKRVLFLGMSGGPSQLDTWDPKPGAETGGPFKAIDTATRGLQISEHLPRLAKASSKYSVIRTLFSKDPNHDTARYLHPPSHGFDGVCCHGHQRGRSHQLLCKRNSHWRQSAG